MSNQPQTHFILHITPRDTWEQAIEQGSYRGDTLDTEGFIHCSMVTQVLDVASQLFHGRSDLVLLLIQASRVASPIKFEGTTAELYPHIYGPLNSDAVVAVYDFLPDEDGNFTLPEELIKQSKD
jgi:uncharacterized protein (DUF952 family)